MIMTVMLVAIVAMTTAGWCSPRVAVMDLENKAQ
jgi:hypothetical protein